MTVHVFLKSVLRLINVLGAGAGETPTDDELNDSLEAFNGLVNEFQNIRPAIFTVQNYTHALTASQQVYTIGAGGNFDTPRPVKIADASVIHSDGVRTPLKIVSKTAWNGIISPNATDTVPLTLYCDSDYPLSKIYLHPKPSGTPTINLFMWQELTEPLGLEDEMAFPPGFHNCFRWNLALDLCVEWGRPISDDMRKRAAETKMELGGLNESDKEATEMPPQAQPQQ